MAAGELRCAVLKPAYPLDMSRLLRAARRTSSLAHGVRVFRQYGRQHPISLTISGLLAFIAHQRGQAVLVPPDVGLGIEQRLHDGSGTAFDRIVQQQGSFESLTLVSALATSALMASRHTF